MSAASDSLLAALDVPHNQLPADLVQTAVRLSEVWGRLQQLSHSPEARADAARWRDRLDWDSSFERLTRWRNANKHAPTSASENLATPEDPLTSLIAEEDAEDAESAPTFDDAIRAMNLEGLEEQIIKAYAAALEAGEPRPTVRALAATLNMHRSTVQDAIQRIRDKTERPETGEPEEIEPQRVHRAGAEPSGDSKATLGRVDLDMEAYWRGESVDARGKFVPRGSKKTCCTSRCHKCAYFDGFKPPADYKKPGYVDPDVLAAVENIDRRKAEIASGRRAHPATEIIARCPAMVDDDSDPVTTEPACHPVPESCFIYD